MIYSMRTYMIALIVILFLSAGSVAMAGDFDDGISTYNDESITDDSKLGDPDTNVSFIVLDAISKSNRGQDDDRVNINDGSGSSNQNSVICEAGSDCSGTIININQ